MNAQYESEYNHHLILKCEAQDGDGMEIVISKEPEDDDNVWISTTGDLFSTKQDRWYYRLALAWKILRGKEFWFHSICVKNKDLVKLRLFLNKYYFSNFAKKQ